MLVSFRLNFKKGNAEVLFYLFYTFYIFDIRLLCGIQFFKGL